MSGVQGNPPIQEFHHYIDKTHTDYKYSIELTVGPADARWTLKARGDDLEQVMADIEKQKSLMQK